MPCYHPMQGYRSKHVEPSGKRKIVFNEKDAFIDLPVTVPCGQCIGCRLERSRQWAIRCVHEASLHKNNCFITLTYSEEKMPCLGSLNLSHYQNFMKRLRKSLSPQKIRFFHCGEYGENTNRPHYHACIFGYDFQDKILWKEKNGVKLYISESLNKLWGHGHCTIGDVTFESAAYVARYITKKVTGENADAHYSRTNYYTGEINKIKPEYVTMSRRPGIASGWFEKYKDDVYPSDEIILRGKQLKPPKYYDGLYEITNKENLEKIKGERIKQSKKHKTDNTPRRLQDREIVKLKQIQQLKRALETNS